MTRTARKEQKEATHRRLVEIGIDFFAERGFANSNTADFAKAAEVSHGTVFLHFPTREALVLRVLDAFGDRLATALKIAMEGEARLEGVLRAHLGVLREYEPFYARLVQEGPLLPMKARSLLFILHASVSHRMNVVAQREAASGSLRRIPRHQLFNTWIALIHYYIANRDIFAPGDSVLDAKGEELVDCFLKLVRN
ncbi:MAG TPA: TetR/AcrR family transcriptional regulator [Roseiarcus sp.]|nr:TetR/AcrR family transcriptional regulator [Roseiarcus sp.]